MNMKKTFVTLLLVAVSWTLVGSPARAAQGNSATTSLAKNQHHHKKHGKKHKKHAKA
jgi:hypothetical protein